MPDTNQREGTNACRRRKAAVSLVAMASLVLSFNSASAQSSVTAPKERPTVKVSEGGVERTPEQIPRDSGINAECVISKTGRSHSPLFIEPRVFPASALIRPIVHGFETDGGAARPLLEIEPRGQPFRVDPCA